MKINILPITDAQHIQELYHLPHLSAKVLASKQLTKEELHDVMSEPILMQPSIIESLHPIIQRLEIAKKKHEKVLICGDYDADGILSTTILYDALNKYGITCGYYIPNRLKEGYGLKEHTIIQAKEKGYTLCITVDNGVKALDALTRAKQEDIDVIVTDHHHIEQEVPCFALLHPNNMPDICQDFCGAAVALQISRALIGECKEHVVFTAVALIGDVMNMRHEARKIVKLGIQYLNEKRCKPIQVLAKDTTSWDSKTIAFEVVPKLNAVGRLADYANVNTIVKYLLLNETSEILEVAKKISDLTVLRKKISDQIMVDVVRKIDTSHSFQIMYGTSYHEGVVGLVAAHISEKTQMPTMVLVEDDGILKGSIRSTNVDLTSFFEHLPFPLLAYGGHKAAAGIRFYKSDLNAMKTYMKEQSYKTKPAELSYDVVEIEAKECSIVEVDHLKLLEPFGGSFSEPIFYLTLHPIKWVSLSKGRHRKISTKEDIDILIFNCDEQFDVYQNDESLSCIGTLQVNEFRNLKRVNMIVKNIEKV